MGLTYVPEKFVSSGKNDRIFTAWRPMVGKRDTHAVIRLKA